MSVNETLEFADATVAPLSENLHSVFQSSCLIGAVLLVLYLTFNYGRRHTEKATKHDRDRLEEFENASEANRDIIQLIKRDWENIREYAMNGRWNGKDVARCAEDRMRNRLFLTMKKIGKNIESLEENNSQQQTLIQNGFTPPAENKGKED